MFGNKNTKEETLPDKLVPSYPMAGTLKEKIAVNIADFPVHTMKGDLNHVGAIKTTPLIKKMTTDDATEVAPVSNKIIIYIIVFLVVALLLIAGYYFWSTRIKNTPATVTPTDTTNKPANVADSSTTNTTTTPITFSTTKSNYLSLDFENSDTASLKTALKKYTDKVAQMNAAGPIEFTVTDATNNPVSFQFFANKMNLSLTQKIISQLTGTFSLYIYIDNSYARLGISAPLKDNAAMELALSQEEKTLPQELAPLLLSTSYDLMALTPSFASSVYNSNQIRYVNISITEPLSIDYTIANNRLIIGTSKLTERSILDYLSANSNSIQTAQ